MKTLILLPFLAIFALGSCDLITEEVEVEKIVERIKTVTKDSIVRDTVYLPGDSIPFPVYIDRIVYVPDTSGTDEPHVCPKDTIHEHHHHFGDTLFVYPGFTSYWVPEQLQDIVTQFYNDAVGYGWEPAGGEFIIEWWLQSEFPPTDRSSYMYNPATNYYQPVIKLKDTLTPDELYTPIYREMMHWQFGTPYSTDTNSIMSPSFPPDRLKFSDSDAEKKVYLDRLFSKEPI